MSTDPLKSTYIENQPIHKDSFLVIRTTTKHKMAVYHSMDFMLNLPLSEEKLKNET